MKLKTGQNLFNAVGEICDGFTPILDEMSHIVEAVRLDNDEKFKNIDSLTSHIRAEIKKCETKIEELTSDEVEVKTEKEMVNIAVLLSGYDSMRKVYENVLADAFLNFSTS